jgi:cytochrome c biogenesis protein
VSLTERETISDVGDAGEQQITSSGGGFGLRGWLRWAWRTLTSMKTALVLLLILVLAAIPGSVFPQRVADELAVNEYLQQQPTLGPVLDRLGMFDVFGSPWFAAIYLLLFISLVGCVVPRSKQLWRQWHEGPPEPPRRVAERAGAVTIAADDATVDAAAEHLRREGWRVTAGASWVSAEKGFLRDLGNLGFHLSMVALLVAVAVGSLLGWRGNVIVREGQGFANTLTQYDQWGGGRAVDPAQLPPFAFTLQSFTVDFERGEAQRGAPRDFEAVVALQREPGAATATETLRVNEPLRIDGADVYLIGHGYAPHLRVSAADGAVLYDDSVVFLPEDSNFTSSGVVKLPDAVPQLAFNGIFAPTATIDEGGPRSLFPAPDAPGLFLAAFTGDLGLDSGVPQSVYRLDTEELEQIGLEGLAPGQSWQLPDGTTVEFVEVQRYVALQISHDPGRIWALLAAALVMAGLMLSLFVPRRRIWLRRTGDSASIAGVARTERAVPAHDVAALAEALSPASPAAGENRGRPGEKGRRHDDATVG